MNERTAALKIQKWWRKMSVRQLIILQARQEFEEMCEQFDDQKPKWNGDYLVMPEFEAPSPDTEKLWLQHAIGQRLSVLKYQEEFCQPL